MNIPVHKVRVGLMLLFVLFPTFGGGCRGGDCSWDTIAQAYVDDNRNGARDPGEVGMAGVMVAVVDSKGNSRGSSWESNAAGNAQIAFFVSCSERSQFMLSAKPPEGYLLTTPERIDAGSESGMVFSFGFASDK